MSKKSAQKLISIIRKMQQEEGVYIRKIPNKMRYRVTYDLNKQTARERLIEHLQNWKQ